MSAVSVFHDLNRIFVINPLSEPRTAPRSISVLDSAARFRCSIPVLDYPITFRSLASPSSCKLFSPISPRNRLANQNANLELLGLWLHKSDAICFHWCFSVCARLLFYARQCSKCNIDNNTDSGQRWLQEQSVQCRTPQELQQHLPADGSDQIEKLHQVRSIANTCELSVFH